MGDWQSIDTAPRDGTEVLAWLLGGYCEVVYWHTLEDHWTAGAGEDVVLPTHWMPLPKGPDA